MINGDDFAGLLACVCVCSGSLRNKWKFAKISVRASGLKSKKDDIHLIYAKSISHRKIMRVQQQMQEKREKKTKTKNKNNRIKPHANDDGDDDIE